MGDLVLTLPLLQDLCASGPGRALVPGPVAAWWGQMGWPVARIDDPVLLGLWSGKPAGESLLEALGRPLRAVVVGHAEVASALRQAGLAVREVDADPPDDRHQSAWLSGRALVPEEVEVPLLEVPLRQDGPEVLLFPGSGGLRKCWPAERYGDLGRRLTRAGTSVGVVLGPAELDRGPGPQAFPGLPVFRAPDLAETASLCAGANWVLGNDAGTTHLAAAVGARGLVLFGPTDPGRWRPLGDRFQVWQGDLATLSVETVLSLGP